VEFQDLDMKFYTTHGEFKAGCNADRWAKELAAGIHELGLEPHPGSQLCKWIKDAGFINVVDSFLPIPLGPWPKNKIFVCCLNLPKEESICPYMNRTHSFLILQKEIGSLDLLQCLDGLEAMSMRVLTHVRGWAAEEVKVFLALVRKDFLNPRMQMMHD
jgi:hypothetical protein